MVCIVFGLGLVIFVGVFFFWFQGMCYQFWFWQWGDDIVVVVNVLLGGGVFVDMQFVGVKFWIGCVDGENVDMYMVFVWMQDGCLVNVVWYMGCEVYGDMCGLIGDFMFIFWISCYVLWCYWM